MTIEVSGATQNVSGTHTVGTITVPGIYVWGIDLSNLALGDEISVHVEEIPRSGGSYTKRTQTSYYQNAQSQVMVEFGPFHVAWGIQLVLTKVSGGSRDIPWFLRRVVPMAVEPTGVPAAGGPWPIDELIAWLTAQSTNAETDTGTLVTLKNSVGSPLASQILSFTGAGSATRLRFT